MRSVIILLLLISSLQTYSQFNDSVHYHVYYGSTGIINKTNDGNSFVLNNALRFNISKKIMTLNFSNSYVYGEQQNRKTNNDFSSTIDFDIYKNIQKLYYWGLGTFDKSYSLKINRRYQVGAGVGYTFLKTETVDFVISDGIIYERSAVEKADNTEDNYGTFRNSARLKYRWVIKDLLIFEGVSFLQNSLSDKNDYILKSNNNASIKLRKWLNFTTAVNYNKLSKTQRENLLITFGLTMETYF
ncbi:MAG: DUF481 domain-containing protein [Chitinophagaceae bacterium]